MERKRTSYLRIFSHIERVPPTDTFGATWQPTVLNGYLLQDHGLEVIRRTTQGRHQTQPTETAKHPLEVDDILGPVEPGDPRRILVPEHQPSLHTCHLIGSRPEGS